MFNRRRRWPPCVSLMKFNRFSFEKVIIIFRRPQVFHNQEEGRTPLTRKWLRQHPKKIYLFIYFLNTFRLHNIQMITLSVSFKISPFIFLASCVQIIMGPRQMSLCKHVVPRHRRVQHKPRRLQIRLHQLSGKLRVYLSARIQVALEQEGLRRYVAPLPPCGQHAFTHPNSSPVPYLRGSANYPRKL